MSWITFRFSGRSLSGRAAELNRSASMMKSLHILAIALLLAVSGQSRADALDKSTVDAIVDLYKWDVETKPKGWLLFLDVFHGGDHADTNDTNNYLTITVAVNRVPKKAAFISFQVSSHADPHAGITGVFAKTTGFDKKGKPAGQAGISIAPTSEFSLPFEKCEDACVARAYNGEVARARGGKSDLLQQFLSFDHLFLTYKVGTETRRVGVPLFDFKSKFVHLE